jgi:hypothetical protein
MSEKSQTSARAGRKTAQAIAALLTSRTIEEAAQTIGVPVSSLRRWRSKPAFAASLCRAQEEILQGVVNSLRSAGLDAATTLRQIAGDIKAPPAARVRASMVIINLLLKAHQLEVIEMRLCALEARKGQPCRTTR